MASNKELSIVAICRTASGMISRVFRGGKVLSDFIGLFHVKSGKGGMIGQPRPEGKRPLISETGRAEVDFEFLMRSSLRCAVDQI